MLTVQQEPLATFITIGGVGNPCAGYFPGSLKYEQCCTQNPGACAPAPIEFFYHPDHLGSSTAITDKNGKPYQLFLNVPFEEIAAVAEILRTPMKNKS